MNIDKGNQANGGEDMVVLGNVANGEVLNREYRIKTLDNMDLPLSVSTDGEGRVWLIVGTDSGFEGLSAFYYSRISYTLSIVEPPSTGGYRPPVWAVALAGLGLMAMRLRIDGKGVVVPSRGLFLSNLTARTNNLIGARKLPMTREATCCP